MNLLYRQSENWKQKAFLLAFAFLFFVIPVFPLLISPAVVLIFFAALFQFRSWSFKGSQFPLLFFPVVLYFFYVIGLVFTDTVGMITVVLERKLSMLIFPVAFLFFPELTRNCRAILWKAFIAGAFLHSIFSLFGALTCYFQSHTHDCFFSSAFSYEVHPSYSAFYLIIILAYLLVSFLNEQAIFTYKISAFFLFFWFSGIIFLLASKAGLVCYGLLLLFGFVYYIFEKRNFKLAFIIGLATIASFLMILVWNPVPVQRIKNSLKASEISDEELFRKHSTSIESNVVRRMIWVCGFELIRENPWGVGSGDANAALMKKYEEKGMTGAMSKEFNAHNQFMQTSIALGFIGGAFLILLIVVFFFYSMKVKNSMLSVFLIVTSLNFLVESMMETESGIVFIVLFLCFLYVDSEKIPKFKRRFN